MKITLKPKFHLPSISFDWANPFHAITSALVIFAFIATIGCCIFFCGPRICDAWTQRIQTRQSAPPAPNEVPPAQPSTSRQDEPAAVEPLVSRGPRAIQSSEHAQNIEQVRFHSADEIVDIFPGLKEVVEHEFPPHKRAKAKAKIVKKLLTPPE